VTNDTDIANFVGCIVLHQHSPIRYFQPCGKPEAIQDFNSQYTTLCTIR